MSTQTDMEELKLTPETLAEKQAEVSRIARGTATAFEYPEAQPEKPARKPRSDKGTVQCYVEIPGVRYDLRVPSACKAFQSYLIRACQEGDTV